MSSTNNDGYAMAELTPADADLTMLSRMICFAPRRAQFLACMGLKKEKSGRRPLTTCCRYIVICVQAETPKLYTPSSVLHAHCTEQCLK